MSRDTSRAGSRFLGLPSTSRGWISATLFLAAVLFMTVTSALFEPTAPTIGKLNVLPAIGAALMLCALLVGAMALVRDRERSWVVWLSTALPAIALCAEAVSLFIGE